MTDPHADQNTEPLILTPLPGSEKAPVAGIAEPHALEPDRPVEATIVLRRRGPAPADVESPLDPHEFAEKYGADPRDAELLRSTLEPLGVTIDSLDLPSRRARVSGSVATMNRVFGAQLAAARTRAADGTEVNLRLRTGGLSVPQQLAGVVTAVLGLDDRPQARAQFRVAAARASTRDYTPLELGRVYRFPPGTDGSGQNIAIIELGGGFAQAELDRYFHGLGISSPKVTAVGVDGAQNVPGGDPSGADGEVLLDIEVAGALSPGSELVVYFAPNTDAGFLDAVSEAAHASPTPAAMSISWGQNEDQWTAQARKAMDDAFLDATLLGITVTAAAGDNGSTDGATDGANHADFPSSSPHALACGGTRLAANPRTGSVTAETVWNHGAGAGATGGGVSSAFGLPAWQKNVGVPASPSGTGGRGVPDVAANADPDTGYQVFVDGKTAVYGGTSAVAPLWAALVARLAQATGTRLGLLQPALYAAAKKGVTAPGFRDVTSGDNGGYAAGPGWDACTGLGVPDGTALLAALRSATYGAPSGGTSGAAIIPAGYVHLLEQPNFGHLGTVRPDDTVQVNPMWFEYDGQYIRFTHTTTRAKFRNLQHNPAMSLSVVDPANPLRYLEVRGRLVDVVPDPAGEFYVRLGRRYGNPGQTPPADRADRVILVMSVEKTTKQ